MLLLFLLCALHSGSDRYYLKRSAGFSSCGKDIFYYFGFKRAFSLIRFCLCFYSVKLLLLLFSLLPFAFTVTALSATLQKGSMSLAVFKIMLVFCALLLVHGLVFFIRLSSFLFLCDYSFVTGRFKDVRSIIAFSYNSMKHNRKKVLRRKLSFIPWLLSCIFLLPAGFVRSYYRQSMADIAADLIERHLQKP